MLLNVFYKHLDKVRKKRNISVNSVLKLIGVSKLGYYAYQLRQPSEQTKRKERVKQEIIQIYNESRQIYGAPKITETLRTRGFTIAEKTVENYMREEGIKSIWVMPYIKTTSDPDFCNGSVFKKTHWLASFR
jgi:putative transposase